MNPLLVAAAVAAVYLAAALPLGALVGRAIRRNNPR